MKGKKINPITILYSRIIDVKLKETDDVLLKLSHAITNYCTAWNRSVYLPEASETVSLRIDETAILNFLFCILEINAL